jgi:hypothetical protein
LGWERSHLALISCNPRPSFGGNAQEQTHDLRVKQPPRLALNRLASRVEWGSTTIGPVGGNGIETIRHSEDADFLARGDNAPERLEKMNRQANGMPLDSGTATIQ